MLSPPAGELKVRLQVKRHVLLVSLGGRMERRVPLDVLVVGMHHHRSQSRTTALRRLLREHPAVRAYGSTQHLEEAHTLAIQGEVGCRERNA